MAPIQARAYARVGLLGNPSDLYAGRGIGFAVREFPLDLTVAPADVLELPNELLWAGWRVFERTASVHGVAVSEVPHVLTFTSEIPYQAGLSGSSALLVAALRAWSQLYSVPLGALELAQLAWRTEVDELGIRAGALDRLVQAHEGFVAMNFVQPFAPGAVRRLDPESLPAVLIAFDTQPGEASGNVHEPIWKRYQAGERAVHAVMRELAQVAQAGVEALGRGDHATLCSLVDHNFDLRAKLFPIGSRDAEMIRLGRELGAATKFCGSGGSVLAIPRSPDQLNALAEQYRAAGFQALVPTIAYSNHD